jgi:nitrite reductase/ring-hydroxylating ferredoxin subunit
MAWVEVTKVEDVPAGKGTVVSVNRQEFALFHVGDEFFCTDNACPHRDGPAKSSCVRGTLGSSMSAPEKRSMRAVICKRFPAKLRTGRSG